MIFQGTFVFNSFFNYVIKKRNCLELCLLSQVVISSSLSNRETTVIFSIDGQIIMYLEHTRKISISSDSAILDLLIAVRHTFLVMRTP